MNLLAALLLSAIPTGAGPRADYLEARTASVYAGACHAAGEYTTQGREAVLAWRFRAGRVDGVELNGAEVVCVLAAPRNLAAPGVRARSLILVDEAAPQAQRRAALAVIRRAYAERLGQVVAVRAVPIDFERSGEAFDLRAGGDVRITGSTLADRELLHDALQTVGTSPSRRPWRIR